ncbi:cadmium-exporting ATPase [[Clostridium] methylpentosum DSM 5476]|uniref:Cd(2+)-exporting ATPase n=1 Tax=[Clostridium] methylpentosum DSM 5476 TaxID=537013 RepID=C0EHA3_9FIRM|nr:cadmium-exporting ATPase [[Clostridium] methylpentosum DSM 5476]MDY3987893.1 heavy metal translocating P-type ATPase [Massilioclostridium sp.]
MVKYKYALDGLNCANCAAKIEAQVGQMEGVHTATVDFVGKSLTIQTDQDIAAFEKKAAPLIRSIDGNVKLISASQQGQQKSKSNFHLPIFTAVASILLFVAGMITEKAFHLEVAGAICFGGAALLAGYQVFLSGFKALARFKLDENTLMTIAVIAAFCLGEFSEAAMVAILFHLGEMLEEKAVNRSRRDIEHLAEIRPDTARLISGEDHCDCEEHEQEHQHDHTHGVEHEHCDCCEHHHEEGGERVVPAEQVQIGDVISVHPYERIPLDGKILTGNSSLDSSALTGESMPLEAEPGTEVLSGMMNGQGLITVEVTNDFSNSAASRIIDMVESSAARKGHAEKLITRFAAIYTPIVIVLAVLLMAIPPLLGLGAFTTWFYRALIFLVASCPCALVISVPLGFFAGIGAQSKNGVLVKGGKYVEVLSHPDAVVFDKTGTLTSGKLSVTEIVSTGSLSQQELLQLAASAEQYSSHPAAQAVLAANTGELLPAADPNEIAGQGVVARVNDRQILCGRQPLMDRYGVETKGHKASIFIAVDGKLEGMLQLADTVKPDSTEAVRRLKELGVKRVVMLTGDNEQSAAKAAEQCGITEYHAGLLPENKVSLMEQIRKESGRTIFVGDGINDAPVLAASDCGVAMGLGTDAAIEASDVVLTVDRPSKLADAVSLSARSMRVIRFNIAFALIVKAAVLVLAATGFAPMWLAVFADVGVSILSVINATRILRFQLK